MSGSDEEQDRVKPTEQRGGTNPDEAEAREKGQWAGTVEDGMVPAELGRIGCAAGAAGGRSGARQLRSRADDGVRPSRPPRMASTSARATTRTRRATAVPDAAEGAESRRCETRPISRSAPEAGTGG